MSSSERSDIEAYYAQGDELGRLVAGAIGALEFERSKEIILRRLPPAPAVVADIGGGPGRYALWLAELGYEVEHRDLMPLHVEQLLASLDGAGPVRTGIRDARDLDLGDASVDSVLLLGPVYHLKRRADRVLALREAGRVVRPGGPVFVAAISRWAPRLDAVLRHRLDLSYPQLVPELFELERTGRGKPVLPGGFTAYFHRPGQLRQEVRAAGLEVADLVSVEGAAFLLGDLADRMADPDGKQVVLEAARAIERVPELVGLGPHLIATAIRRA
ncbi:MAG TPA: class I SAM-dependent methyltransferase [Streptosporangiaceae bacterium]|nr:class I SAM-dependent methyltransferase [Streptosporangiaceae bacterium]